MRTLSQKHISIVVVVVAFLLSVALTWPVGLSLQSTLVGHPGNDTWNHVWGYWWVSEELSGRYPHAMDSRFLGRDTYFIDTPRFYSPFQSLTSSAFICIMLGELALAGVGAWLLPIKLRQTCGLLLPHYFCLKCRLI